MNKRYIIKVSSPNRDSAWEMNRQYFGLEQAKHAAARHKRNAQRYFSDAHVEIFSVTEPVWEGEMLDRDVDSFSTKRFER